MMQTIFLILFICIVKITNFANGNFDIIDLPTDQLSYHFNNFPHIVDQCQQDSNCKYQQFLQSSKYNPNACWGYEDYCRMNDSFGVPRCVNVAGLSSKNLDVNVDKFYKEADFGYIREQRNEMKIMCEPLFPHDSVLECSNHMRFCRGRNLLFNFTDLVNRPDPFRYKMDVLSQGQVGGYCKFYKDRLQSELDHMSALQSWSPELRYFESFLERPIEAKKCTKIIDKPTFLMKIDATSNLYHHFCDFFNLYASLHVNMSHPATFSTDINIVIWETFDYRSSFAETFKAFTQNPILDLKSFRGDVVCFKNVVLPLLPRMIFGLYYNTPLVTGCEKSGLFQAFSDHILHRLNIPIHSIREPRIRITFLSRLTKYRQILNIHELLNEINKNETYIVRRVNFERSLPFRDQLEITRNTDIFIGMHGAGLTHLLFLPKWASLFELYNCEDPACYRDLARLRGINYVTWEDDDKLYPQDEGRHPDGGAHAKFTNYSFDKYEFVRLVNKAADFVWNHEEYRQFIAKHYDSDHDEL